ncbi:response regulator transcription factor [Amycolatopsis sp. NPDC089917]|uniref:response regulator transcription factor n=1 Tax=Amycolatopsis sp. NPDC089917 TaxID=3155187 RepID=UPI00342F206B
MFSSASPASPVKRGLVRRKSFSPSVERSRVPVRNPRPNGEYDGIEVTKLLAGRGVPDPIEVVVITTFDLDEYIHGALRAGARGFLLKDAGTALLVQAVHAAAAGDALIAPNITRRLLATLAAREPSSRRTQPIEPLTEREEEVLMLVARGRTNAEIAAELFIGLTTAKTHVASLLAKIGARNRVEIAMWAYDTGRAGDPRPGTEDSMCRDRYRRAGRPSA